MANFMSSCAQLMQSDSDCNSDSPISLFDFINSHKSVVNEDEDIKSLSDLTAKHLNMKEHQNVSSYLSTQFNNLGSSISIESCVSEKPEKEASNGFSSLEDYANAFLNSKSDSTQCQAIYPPSILKFQDNSINTDETNTKTIDERLSSIRLGDSRERGRKIDLTAALLNATKTQVSGAVGQSQDQVHRRMFYPTKECIIDISSLAEETVAYSNVNCSDFGYVMSRKWDRILLPRRYRRIEKTRPYNIAKSFKFDTLSPDDNIRKKRTRVDTV